MTDKFPIFGQGVELRAHYLLFLKQAFLRQSISKSCGPGPIFDGFGSTPILLLLKIPRNRIPTLGLEDIFRNSGGMYIYGQSKSGLRSHWVLPCCGWIGFRVIAGRHPDERCIFREMSGAGVLTPVLRRRHCRLPDLSHRGNY